MRKRIDSFSNRLSSLAPTWRRRVSLGVAIVTVTLAASAAIAPKAYAADDDDEDTIETKFIKGLFGINDRDKIDYRERPPLVVPPNAGVVGALPAPETGVVNNTPAWPKDPEIVERAKRQKANKNQKRRTPEEEARALTPAELDAPGRAARGSSQPNPTGPQDSEGPDSRALRPSELGAKGSLLGNLFKDNTKPEQATFNKEPNRTDLTQPPPGYQTPSSGQVYGIAPKKEQAKPFDWINNHGTGN